MTYRQLFDEAQQALEQAREMTTNVRQQQFLTAAIVCIRQLAYELDTTTCGNCNMPSAVDLNRPTRTPQRTWQDRELHRLAAEAHRRARRQPQE